MARRYRGLVMSRNPAAARESRHEGDHWYIAEECDPIGCRPRDAEAPAEEPRITADTVVVERHIGSTVGVDRG